jgi:hypothetical protein
VTCVWNRHPPAQHRAHDETTRSKASTVTFILHVSAGDYTGKTIAVKIFMDLGH